MKARIECTLRIGLSLGFLRLSGSTKMLEEEAEAVDTRESSEDNEGRRVDCLGWEFNL